MARWEVSSQESGTKLLAFLKNKLGDAYSARQLKKAIENNFCQINQRVEHFATANLGEGDTVIFHENSLQTSETVFKLENDRILYEDPSLLAYNKPAGITSDDTDLIQALQQKASNLMLVHRLDRDTTGVLLFAKSKDVLDAMTVLFKKRLVNKTYLALVDGIPAKKSGIIDNYLGALHRYQGQTMWGPVEKPKGLHAITEWQCEKKFSNACLIYCFPKTGRTHQIRVHLSEMGNPILGDSQYGKKFRCDYRPSRCLLHAKELTFMHPSSNQKVTITAPLPDDFASALKHLEGTGKQT